MEKELKAPKLRFPGFTDDWEQRKVSDLLEERNEQAPESAEYPLMAFIANEGVAPKGERYDRGALVKDAENKNYKKTELGDFIYSSNNLETGSIGLNNYGNASISPVYSIFRPTGIVDSDFIGRRFVRKDFINSMVKWRQGVVYGQWRIHESDFLKIEVAVPSLEEQRKIGDYFRNLNTLITLHQRKLDTLKKLKKGFLQKMFPKNGESVPEIRFPGFTDAWEQRKLGDIYQRNTERNTNLIDYSKTISVATMSFKDEGNGASEDSLSSYKVLRIGDIAFEGHTNKQFRFGRFVVNDIGIGIMSPRFSTLRPIGDLPVNFWKQYIHYEPIMRKVLVNATKAGTMMNELVIPEFLNQTILIPQNDEQKKIGDYFSKLDNLITLHQRKLDTLKKFKQGMLQQMFI